MLPGAIHNLGGIRINERCKSSVPGLFAAGECAGLVHGASRTAGNALTDCIVFGAIAGRNAAEYAASIKGSAVGVDAFREKESFLDDMLREKRAPIDS